MLKKIIYICSKCAQSFKSEEKCLKHEEVCEELRLLEVFLSVNSTEGVLIDSAVTTANRIDVNTIRVCDQTDDGGYPITRSVELMDPEVEGVGMDGYNFIIWCTKDQEHDAERKLREYAKKVLKDQRSKLDMMIRKLEEV